MNRAIQIILSALIFAVGLYDSLRLAVLARGWWGNLITIVILAIGAIGSGVLAVKLHHHPAKTRFIALVFLITPIVLLVFISMFGSAGVLP